jgi:uncharacterized protein
MNNNPKNSSNPFLLICAVAVILFYSAESISTEAVSLDCAKSITNVEKLVCSDAEITNLDLKLNLAYKAAQRKTLQKLDLKQTQKKWLVERDSCQDIACLRRTYSSRISELWHLVDPALSESDESAACNTVADYANRGEISKLYVSIDKNALPNIQKHFSDLSGITGYWFVDLDNDGFQDPIVIEEAGTAHIASVAAKSSRYSNIYIGLENDFQKGELDLSLVFVLGKYYVLSKDDAKLIRMWHVAKGNFAPMCAFKQRENPNIQILKGGNSPVCQAVLSDKVSYVAFTPMSFFLNDYDILKGEVMADVTNSGHQSKVSLVNMLTPGGRGCSWLEIKMGDEKNPEQLNSVLHKRTCNSKQDLFVLNDNTYIGERAINSNMPRSVHMVRGMQSEEICTFESRPYYEVKLSE